MMQDVVEWLRRGAAHGNGQLPLFDTWGDRISRVAIDLCMAFGFIEPWFANPLKPDWTVYRITDRGRAYAAAQNDNEGGEH